MATISHLHRYEEARLLVGRGPGTAPHPAWWPQRVGAGEAGGRGTAAASAAKVTAAQQREPEDKRKNPSEMQ